MGEALDKLLSAASPSLAAGGIDRCTLPNGSVGDQLAALLGRRNGFFAFESALLLRPCTADTNSVLGISQWNAPNAWKSSYGGLFDDVAFFAEDIFGGQFGATSDAVVSLSPEDGALDYFADSIDSWAAQILDDYGVLTGFPLAHEWQALHGPLMPGARLVPRVPFMLGGEFSVDNLRLASDVSAMRFYGGLATAVSAVPDGADVVVNIRNLSLVLDSDSGPGGPQNI